jgi:adenylate kinase family enzyme
MQPLPDRIWIVGPCGSGKSTLAAKLAAHLGVEPTHMDEIFHQPGWTEAPAEQVHARLREVTAGPRWVIDGNYRKFREPCEDRIQLYVFLDLPLYVTFPRLVRRGVRRSVLKEPCCNGNQESLQLTFFDRESLLLYALTGSVQKLTRLRRHVLARRHVRLRSQRAADRWLAAVTGAGWQEQGTDDDPSSLPDVRRRPGG